VTRRFAYRKEFATEPIARALQQRGWAVDEYDDPAKALLERSADLVLTPSLDYARSIGVVDFALVPGVAIVTSGFAGLLKLIFKPGLSEFTTVATRDVASSDTMIARIVLSEKHDMEPRFIAAPNESVDEMLQHADAALLYGDDAIFDQSGSTSYLDLTDEWEDLSETPLPYMLAWGRVGEVDEVMLAEFAAARDAAVLTIADFAARHQHPSEANAFYERYLKGGVRYSLEDNDLVGLDAMHRFAFYYALVSDVASIKYLPDGEPADIPEPPIT
jgi:predicted solute-binding protein